MAERKRTILLVEDERSITEPFASALEREGFEAVVAPTARAALELFRRRDPSLVLLDIALPDGDGREVCRELRRESSVPIIMLTARGTETDRVVGLELGADDYVVKPFSAREVVARVRAVLRRSSAVARTAGDEPLALGDLRLDRAAPARAAEEEAPEAPITIDALHVDLAARRATLDGEELSLSRKEFDLLERLMREPARVVTREQLMSGVCETNWLGSTKTLDVHIGWLRRKLDDDPADPRWIHTVRGVGFRFASTDEVAP